jgi:hypothetical protein
LLSFLSFTFVNDEKGRPLLVRDVWISDSSPGNTEQFEEKLFHLQARVLWHGDLSNVSLMKQNVHVVVRSDLIVAKE